LDDFDDSLFTESSEGLGFPGLESSASTLNMDPILDSEDRSSLKSRPCSSQSPYSWTSLPEGNLQHLSSDESYAPTADHTYMSNKNVENPESSSTQCNIVLKDIAKHYKRKCSPMLITFRQNEGQYSSGCADKVTNIVGQGGQEIP
jgi:hypothetical protein